MCTLGDQNSPRCWPRELLEEGIRMREAVQFMHQRGVVHMNIKASNIFISAADGQWYLGDFGSSKRMEEVTPRPTCTPTWMSSLSARRHIRNTIGSCCCLSCWENHSLEKCRGWRLSVMSTISSMSDKLFMVLWLTRASWGLLTLHHQIFARTCLRFKN